MLLSIYGGRAREDVDLLERLLHVTAFKKKERPAVEHFAAMYGCAIHGHSESVALLADAGFPLDGRDFGPAIVAAMMFGHVETARVLISKGVDVNATARSRRTVNEGATALAYAAALGDVDLAGALLEAGARPDARGQKGATFALLEAAANDDDAMLRLLLERGAEVDLAVAGGKTALHVAALCDASRAVAALVDAGAAIDAKTTGYGETPLSLACEHGHTAAALALIERGANARHTPRSTGSGGCLQRAVQGRNAAVVGALVEAGATADGPLYCLYGGEVLPAHGGLTLAAWFTEVFPARNAEELPAALARNGVVFEDGGSHLTADFVVTPFAPYVLLLDPTPAVAEALARPRRREHATTTADW